MRNPQRILQTRVGYLSASALQSPFQINCEQRTVVHNENPLSKQNFLHDPPQERTAPMI